MSKIVLSNVADITQSTTAQTTINTNSSTVQTAFDNTLSRDGTSPNQMGSTLDMNSNQIINLPAPGTVNSPARLIDITTPIPVPSAILSGNNVFTGTNSFSSSSTFNGSAGFNSSTSFGGSPNTFNGSAVFNGSVTLPSTIPTIAGNNIWTGNNYFMNGKPWADAIAWGADPSNTLDSTSAIQSAINFLYNNFGGGIVFFPQGSYKVTTGPLILKGGVRLVGASRSATSLGSATTNATVVAIDSTGSYCSIENMFIEGDQGAGPTVPAVTVASGAAAILRDCNIWGGTSGLQIAGTDGLIENCYIAGAVSNVSSTGANWYIRCKLDTVGLGPPTNGFIQTATGENHFMHCDFSGNFTNSVTINDGSATCITTFEGCVFSSPIIITSAKASMFSACEIGSTTFTVGTNPTAVTGCFSFATFSVSGAGKVVSGCINIT